MGCAIIGEESRWRVGWMGEDLASNGQPASCFLEEAHRKGAGVGRAGALCSPQNAHVALRLVRKLKAPGRHRDTLVVQYAHRAFGGLWHIPHCRAQVLAFSASCEATVAMGHLAKMNPCAEHPPASSIAEDALAQGKSKIIESNNSKDTPQLPAERLNRLENIVEQHGRSLASLASHLEEQKQLFASILRDMELLKSDPASKDQHLPPPLHAEDVLHSMDVSASSSTHLCAPPWPEWTSFLQHLKGLPFFKESGEEPDFGGRTTFDDPPTVKRMLAKFSQAYEHIFDSLSVTHLQILAEHRCPNGDRRTLMSANRLRNHFQMEEKRNSCDIKPANPKLSDVTRLIYTIAEVARKDGTPDELKLSISHLLEEMISVTSNHKQHKIVDPETLKDSVSVWPKSHREKSQTVVEGSSSLCDSEILSQHDKWKCPRCSCMNRQSKSKCMECSFSRIEKSALDIDKMMHKSSTVSTNKIDTKVCVLGKETKEKIVSAAKEYIDNDRQAATTASKEYIVLDNNDRQAATTEALLKQGLENISRRSLAAQEQEGLQKHTLSEEDQRNLGGSGLIDVSDADEHSDIFDDIFDSDDTSSSKAEQNTFMKCSLSDLVRQNKKSFSSSKRERGAATGADDYERTGLRPFSGKGYKPDDLDVSGKGYKPDDLDVSRRGMSYRAERDDSVMEAEDKGMLPHQGRTSAGSILGIKHDRSYNYKAGMGFSGRTFSDDRSRNKGRQRYNREGYSDADSEDGQRYSSGKINCSKGPRYKESKARGAYSDESGGCGSNRE